MKGYDALLCLKSQIERKTLLKCVINPSATTDEAGPHIVLKFQKEAKVTETLADKINPKYFVTRVLATLKGKILSSGDALKNGIDASSKMSGFFVENKFLEETDSEGIFKRVKLSRLTGTASIEDSLVEDPDSDETTYMDEQWQVEIRLPITE